MVGKYRAAKVWPLGIGKYRAAEVWPLGIGKSDAPHRSHIPPNV